MSNDTREFELGAVISAVTGRLVARQGIGSMHKLFEYITGGPVWTHELPSVADACKPGLVQQFPWMIEIVIPDDLNANNWEQWLDDQAAIYGATLHVQPLDLSRRRSGH